MLSGKGFFIWRIERCAPNAATLVRRAQQAGLGHVLIKISDGSNIFPNDNSTSTAEKLTQESITALQAAQIEVWGWAVVYGGNDPDPISQAHRVVQRMHQFGLQNVVINAEKWPGFDWQPGNARAFMEELIIGLDRIGNSSPLLALSSYRFPSFHPDFPFDEFLGFCQVAMPQVYWVSRNGGDPIKDLQACYDEYITRFPTQEFIPTGAAYGEQQTIGTETFYWEARPDQVTMFLNQAQAMDFSAVNFWSWEHAFEKPALWEAIAAFPFRKNITRISDTVAAIPNTEGVSNPAVPAVGLPDTTEDDGLAIIEVGAPGYQEGIYAGTKAELVTFVRNNVRCTWVQGERDRSTAYSQWLPRIATTGEYLIEAWIPGINATTRRARYHVTGVIGQETTTVVEVNQLNFSDEWVRLGFFELDAGQQFSGMVGLNNLVGPEANNRTQVAFGPIRWRKVSRIGVEKGFADGFDSPVGTPEERVTEKIWPGQWVDANPFLNSYFLGYHTGVDLNLPRDMDKGAPAYSIADGVVTYSGVVRNRDGSPSGFGNLVVIRHDPYRTREGDIVNIHSRYGHMKDLVVEVGKRVRRGDQVGTIWNVGTQAHHLHFDISPTGILESSPGHWPGSRRREVEKHYVDPAIFIPNNRPLI